ncbi:MAG: tetratricopeptide repeat protein, partial [Spirochaetaceae bacterium]|nr:tetratricopeptide repeat protein [Spirochaetaceae bacterium]
MKKYTIFYSNVAFALIAGFVFMLVSCASTVDAMTAEAYFDRGIAYFYNGDYDKAIADYTQTIRLDPDNVIAYYNRGVAYHDKGDYDKAIADYTQAIKIYPEYAAVHNNRGIAHDNNGEYDKAIADYTQAI